MSVSVLLNLGQTALELGLTYSLTVLALFLSYSMLNVCDLSTDGCFTLGAAVGAMVALAGHPYLSIPVAMLAGAASGFVTAILQTRMGVDSLLSGIIVMTGLYSVNLHVAGRANVQLFSFDTMFKNSFISALPAAVQPYAPVVILALLTLVVKLLMDAYLATRSGFLLRATGDNPTLVASLAKDSGKVKILGLSIANALVSLAGCVMCQYQRYFDISMGTGTLVLAVASVIVGTQLVRGMRFLGATLAVILGSILYKGCVALALSLGLSPFDLKLITAVLLLVIIVLGGHKRKVKPRA